MTLLCQPVEIIDYIQEEKDYGTNGFFQRFLICAPKPLFITNEEMRSTPKPTITILCLLYAIEKIFNNKDEIFFRFDENDAIEEYCRINDQFDEIRKLAYNKNTFIWYVIQN